MLDEALTSHKRHFGSVKLIKTTQFLLIFPLITNHTLCSSVFSRMATLPFPSRVPKVDISVEWVRTMLKSSERRHNLIFSILNLQFTASDLFLPFYSKVHNSLSFDSCIFYLSEYLGYNLLISS